MCINNCFECGDAKAHVQMLLSQSLIIVCQLIKNDSFLIGTTCFMGPSIHTDLHVMHLIKSKRQIQDLRERERSRSPNQYFLVGIWVL